MGGFARWTAAGALALSLALTGCGRSPSASSSATVPPTAPPTIPADPYAVPATIDAAYLNKVFLALEHVDGDATRLIVANKKLVPEAAKRLIAIYGEDELHRQSDAWLDLVAKGLDEFRPVPGDLQTTVNRVLSQKPGCVFTEVQRSYNEIRVTPRPVSTEYIAIRRLDTSRDPARLNPTPWMITAEGYNRDGSVPSDPCER